MVGRSLCVCGRQLRWSENMPVISYLALKGRSSCCKAGIPRRYLTTELSFTLATGASFALFGHAAAFVSVAALSAATLLLKEPLRRL